MWGSAATTAREVHSIFSAGHETAPRRFVRLSEPDAACSAVLVTSVRHEGNYCALDAGKKNAKALLLN